MRFGNGMAGIQQVADLFDIHTARKSSELFGPNVGIGALPKQRENEGLAFCIVETIRLLRRQQCCNLHGAQPGSLLAQQPHVNRINAGITLLDHGTALFEIRHRDLNRRDHRIRNQALIHLRRGLRQQENDVIFLAQLRTQRPTMQRDQTVAILLTQEIELTVGCHRTDIRHDQGR